MPFLIILGIIALFIVLWRLGVAAERKRSEALAAWAEAQGFSFAADACDGAPSGCTGFELLQRGRNRCASNRCSGRIKAGTVVAFDWRYVTGSGKNRTTHRCSAVALLPGVVLGNLRIREEHFFDKLGEMLGWNDIDFESAEFSRTFHVSAEDRRWAYDVITPQAMELLLAAPRFSIEMRGNGLLLWRNRRLEVADLSAALGLAEDLLGAIQPAVRRQLGLA